MASNSAVSVALKRLALCLVAIGPCKTPTVSSCVACAATLAAAYCGSQLVVVVVVVALPLFACSGFPVMSVVSSVLYGAPAATTGCCKCFISSCSHVTPNSSEYDVCHEIRWRWCRPCWRQWIARVAVWRLLYQNNDEEKDSRQPRMTGELAKPIPAASQSAGCTSHHGTSTTHGCCWCWIDALASL